MNYNSFISARAQLTVLGNSLVYSIRQQYCCCWHIPETWKTLSVLFDLPVQNRSSKYDKNLSISPEPVTLKNLLSKTSNIPQAFDHTYAFSNNINLLLSYTKGQSTVSAGACFPIAPDLSSCHKFLALFWPIKCHEKYLIRQNYSKGYWLYHLLGERLLSIKFH